MSPALIATPNGYQYAQIICQVGDFAVCERDGKVSLTHLPTGAGLKILPDSDTNRARLSERLVPLLDVPSFGLQEYELRRVQLREILEGL